MALGITSETTSGITLRMSQVIAMSSLSSSGCPHNPHFVPIVPGQLQTVGMTSDHPHCLQVISIFFLSSPDPWEWPQIIPVLGCVRLSPSSKFFPHCPRSSADSGDDLRSSPLSPGHFYVVPVIPKGLKFIGYLFILQNLFTHRLPLLKTCQNLLSPEKIPINS